MPERDSTRTEYDVIIVGCALGGSSTAILLLDGCPELRVLLVDKSPVLGRRVGEATVEVSTYFLQRCLGLTRHLHQHHLVKNGLRFWFANEQTANLSECGEVGGRFLSRLPAYLVDRAVLDEEALRVASEKGAEVWRPASVTDIALEEGGTQKVRVKSGEQVSELTARWVVDASGVAAFLARRNGWLQSNTSHRTSACWARFTGVGDFDDADLRRRYPDWARRCFSMRGSATNHLMGEGWWAWWIPLREGEVSLGVVFDQRLVEWPAEGNLSERLMAFLRRHPVGRELLAGAEICAGDVHFRRNLAYSTSRVCGDGHALVGDAAGFLDPFYSPGLDWMAFTACSNTEIILAWKRGEAIAPLIESANRRFARSYPRWFSALYRDKYEYLGEFDLMKLAFRLDVALYYLGVVSQPYYLGAKALQEPYFSQALSAPFSWLMSTYNRRFAAMARERRRRGLAGRWNARRHHLVEGFNFNAKTVWTVVCSLVDWWRLELGEGWRTWFRRVPAPVREELPAAPEAAPEVR